MLGEYEMKAENNPDALAGPESVDHYVVAEVPCNLQPQIHPDYPTIRYKHADWVFNHFPFCRPGRLPRAIEQCDALYDSLVIPVGIGERVFHHGCLTTLAIESDDQALLTPTVFDKVSVAGADDPISLGWADALAVIRTNAPTEAVYQRIHDCWRDWVLSLQQLETPLRDSGDKLDLDTLLSMRQTTVGLKPHFPATEYALDIDATDVVSDADGTAALELSLTHIIIVNDIYSYRKEYIQGDTLNSISILRDQGYSIQESIDFLHAKACDCNQRLAEVVARLHHRYTDHPIGDKLHSYIDCYNRIPAGNLQWHLESPRYNGRGYIWDGRRTHSVGVSAEGNLFPIEPLE
jgi:terpene synthase-like protein